MVRIKDIIGVFDIQVERSGQTARFIEMARNNSAVEVVDIGEIKSFVVTEKKLYYSPISSSTLKKRAYSSYTG
jgi:hypothetical protein